MKTLRAGLLGGAWRRLSSVPPLILHVRGWPRLLADCLGLGRRPYRLRSKGGAGCEVRPGTSDWWIFLEIFVFDIYRRVQQDISRSRVIIDVGANVGFFAIHAGSLNAGVEIHAFEPFPGNLEQMKRNLGLNPGCHVHLHPQAVSDRSGAVTLFFTPGDDSGCALDQTRMSQGKTQTCSVEALGVNELLPACGVDQCDLLKMDCEGSELSILRAAAPQTLAKIDRIIMEYHADDEVESLRGILAGAGFRCEVLESIHTLYATRT
jgi:FkbM family methyltransferase